MKYKGKMKQMISCFMVCVLLFSLSQAGTLPVSAKNGKYPYTIFA